MIGKYKGKSFEDVYNNHRKYATYIQLTDIKHPSLLEFRKWMNNKIPLTGPTTFIEKRGGNISGIVGSPEIFHTKIGTKLFHLPWVAKGKFYSQYGVFVDHLIRYIINYKLDRRSRDWRAEEIIEQYSGTNIYIPKLRESYKRYNMNIPVGSALNDIWIVSLSHGFWFNRKINKVERLSKILHNPLVEIDLIKNITNFISSYDISKFELNPRLTCPGIPLIGDADLINSNTLIDIKTSSCYIGSSIEDFYQLYYYAILRNLSNHNCTIKQLVIFNSLIGYTKTIDVSEFNWRYMADFVFLV